MMTKGRTWHTTDRTNRSWSNDFRFRRGGNFGNFHAFGTRLDVSHVGISPDDARVAMVRTNGTRDRRRERRQPPARGAGDRGTSPVFPQVDAFIGHGPHDTAGSPAPNVAAIRAPVLLFHGDRDSNLGVAESRMTAPRPRGARNPVKLVEVLRLDHRLAGDAVRADMPGRADAWIRRATGV